MAQQGAAARVGGGGRQRRAGGVVHRASLVIDAMAARRGGGASQASAGFRTIQIDISSRFGLEATQMSATPAKTGDRVERCTAPMLRTHMDPARGMPSAAAMATTPIAMPDAAPPTRRTCGRHRPSRSMAGAGPFQPGPGHATHGRYPPQDHAQRHRPCLRGVARHRLARPAQQSAGACRHARARRGRDAPPGLRLQPCRGQSAPARVHRGGAGGQRPGQPRSSPSSPRAWTRRWAPRAMSPCWAAAANRRSASARCWAR